MSCIKFDSVTKNYQILTIIDNLSFEIYEEEFVGHLGLNGAGKSTTMKILSGILSPDSGYVRIFGKDPISSKKEILNKIGVLFGHRSQLLWDLPVYDTIELYKTLYHIPKEV